MPPGRFRGILPIVGGGGGVLLVCHRIIDSIFPIIVPRATILLSSTLIQGIGQKDCISVITGDKNVLFP